MTSTKVISTAKPWEHSVGSAQLPPETKDNAILTRDKYEPVQLSVADCRKLRQDSFAKVEALIPQEDIRDISLHMDGVIQGKETAKGFPEMDPSIPEAEHVARFSRIHNAHRVHHLLE